MDHIKGGLLSTVDPVDEPAVPDAEAMRDAVRNAAAEKGALWLRAMLRECGVLRIGDLADEQLAIVVAFALDVPTAGLPEAFAKARGAMARAAIARSRAARKQADTAEAVAYRAKLVRAARRRLGLGAA